MYPTIMIVHIEKNFVQTLAIKIPPSILILKDDYNLPLQWCPNAI